MRAGIVVFYATSAIIRTRIVVLSTKRDDHGINEDQNLLNEYPGAINEDQILLNEYPGAINEDQNLLNEYPGAIKFLPFCTQNNNAVTMFYQKMTANAEKSV